LLKFRLVCVGTRPRRPFSRLHTRCDRLVRSRTRFAVGSEGRTLGFASLRSFQLGVAIRTPGFDQMLVLARSALVRENHRLH